MAAGAATRPSSPSGTGELVATKLQAPQPREGLVARPELVARLLSGGERRLALVCAPAGWGKTVLLGQWQASAEETRPFAWVSLEPGDSDPVRFWGYLIAALRTIEPKLGEAALAALPWAGRGLVDAVVGPLINELVALPERLVLVLDDYHLSSSEAVHESVVYLLQHLPPNVEFAIACRADPPLPLASLRAAGEVTEIRAAELGFSAAEANALLNASLGLGLEREDVELLQARTEGWAAGLQLAALSVRGHEDRHAFVEAFAGDDRQIGDYLDEVLADQPASLRDFLLQTSILERMCAPLCDALTGAGDGASRLEQVERSNLFLVALDSRRRWYRYHHLFRDLLRHELVRSRPDLVDELHRRAAAWHRDEGDADEAIAQATAAGDFEAARELIRAQLDETYVLGQYETVARWIDALPRSTVRDDARLCAARAWCALNLGRLDEAASWRKEFEPVETPGSGAVGTGAAPEFEVVAFDGAYAHCLGDVGRALEAGWRAVVCYPDVTDPRRAFAQMNHGHDLYYAGELSAAAALFDEAVSGLAASERSLLVTHGLLFGHASLALVLADLGDVDRAERSIAEGERLFREAWQGEYPGGEAFEAARGRLLELRGDLAAAEEALTHAETIARRYGWPLEHAHFLLLLARVKQRLRKHTEARALVREARGVLRPCPDPGILRKLLAQTERRLQLAPAPASAPALPVDLELSERELAILRLLAGELSQREIGSELYISLNTVKAHVRSIYRKLGVASRAEAVARGRELDLI